MWISFEYYITRKVWSFLLFNNKSRQPAYKAPNGGYLVGLPMEKNKLLIPVLILCHLRSWLWIELHATMRLFKDKRQTLENTEISFHVSSEKYRYGKVNVSEWCTPTARSTIRDWISSYTTSSWISNLQTNIICV